MNKRFFTLMAAVMLAGAPLCNEAYADNVNYSNVAADVKLENGVKFILNVSNSTIKATSDTDPTSKKTYMVESTDASAKEAIFEVVNVQKSALGITFGLKVDGKTFAHKDGGKYHTIFSVAATQTTLNTITDINAYLENGTKATNAFVSTSGSKKVATTDKDYDETALVEFNAKSTTFSFGEGVEGNIFSNLTPITVTVTTSATPATPATSTKYTYFVSGKADDVKAFKAAFTTGNFAATGVEAAAKKLSFAAVTAEAWGLNTSVDGEGYKLAMVNGAAFYADEPLNPANAAFTGIKEADQLNAEGEIELTIKPVINKADGTPVVTGATTLAIKSVKASASDPKTYVTTVDPTGTLFYKTSNPVLGANTFFAATNFLKAGEVSAFNVFFTSGKAQPAGVQPQEYGRYLSVVSDGTAYKLHATSPDSTMVDAPLSQWIVSNFDGRNTITLTSREGAQSLNLKLEATKNAGEYNVVGGSNATTAIDNIVAGTTTPTNVFKSKTIKLIPTTLTKNDGYVVLSKEDMSGTIGVKFSGKDAIKGNQTYYMQFEKPATGATTTKFVPTLKASDAVEVNFKLNEVDNTKDLVINNYAYLDKEGRILTDAADTLAIPSYTVSYTYNKKAYYVKDGNLNLETAETAALAGASQVVLKKHFNGSYGFGVKGQAKSAAGATSAATSVAAGAFTKDAAKINALNDADFAYASLSLQDKNDYETLKAVSRHATFEAVNVAGGVSMQENKNGILEGIIGADALTFWLDTADSEKATPSFYISKGIAKAEETKAYNDEVRNFLFTPTDSAKIYNEGSATAAVDKKYILEGTEESLKAIFRPAALIAEDTMTTVVDGKELTVVTKDADADKAQVNGLKNFQYGIVLADEEVADEYVIYSKANPSKYLYSHNGKLGFGTKAEALVVTLGEGDATANEAIAAENVAVIAGEGVVTVKGAAGKQVVVSNILGQVIANKVATSDEETIAVAAGVAVVVVDGEATKVVVK